MIINDETDMVNHPAHYETGKYECIDVMQEAIGTDETAAFCLCNAFKYLYRCKRKNETPVEDVQKADWYLQKYLELKGGQNGKSDRNKNESADAFTMHNTAGSGI